MARVLNPTKEQIESIVTQFKSDMDKGKLDINATNFKVEFNLQKLDKKAVIDISELAWKKMKSLITECSKEVAWHCLVTKENNFYHIHDVLVFPQVVTGSTVNSDETEYTNWINSLDDYEFNELRCHMHSHVNMGVHPSSVDTTYQNSVIQNEPNFYIFMIWNKREEAWATIVDVQDNIIYFDEDIEVQTPNEVGDWAQTMLKQYVKEFKGMPQKPCTRTEKAKKEKPKQYTYADYQRELVQNMDKPTKEDADIDDFHDIEEMERQLDAYWRQYL